MIYMTTLLLRLLYYASLHKWSVIFLSENPVNPSTSLLRPLLYGQAEKGYKVISLLIYETSLVVITEFHCSRAPFKHSIYKRNCTILMVFTVHYLIHSTHSQKTPLWSQVPALFEPFTVSFIFLGRLFNRRLTSVDRGLKQSFYHQVFLEVSRFNWN